MSDASAGFADALNDFLRQALDMQSKAIEECAERILLSGTNWGIRVWSWVDGLTVTVIAEPTPETRSIVFMDGPAPADMPRWRVCPNSPCSGGWVDVTDPTGFALVRQEACRVCDGKGWVQW